MKKLILLIFASLLIFGEANAQEVGVRFGNSFAGNVAVDGVFMFNKTMRIHADVSFGDGVSVDALWDFKYARIPSSDFNWYAGVGVSTNLGDDFLLGAVGEVGVEYRFDFPVSLSLDWRPTFAILDETDLYLDNFGFNIRYVF